VERDLRSETRLGEGLLQTSGQYTPFGLRFEGPVRCLWLGTGEEPLGSVDFDGEVRRILPNSLSLTTGLDALHLYAEEFPGLHPSGFIFHMTRCGSTLAARMLGAVEGAVAYSEPQVISNILAGQALGLLSDPDRVLRSCIGVLARSADVVKRPFFLKFSSWNVLHLGRIRSLFPEVPWLFLFRDPVEVLVSQVRTPSSSLCSELPVYGGLDLEGTPGSLERTAQLLEAFCSTALEHLHDGGRLLEYPNIVDGLLGDSGAFLGLGSSPSQQQAMLEAARWNSKKLGEVFESDKEHKRAEASTELLALAEERLNPLYEELKAAAR